MTSDRQQPLSCIGRLAGFLTTLVLLLASPLASAEQTTDLVPFKANYTATMEKGIELSGTGTRSLTDQGNGVWLYRTDVKSFIANIDESLVLKWENGRVIPLRYRYRLSGLFIKDRKKAIDFDWSAGTASGEYKGKSFELPLKEGTLDPLGYQLQLRQDIKAGLRDMTYEVIDGDEYDTTHFAILEKEPETASSDLLRGTLKAEKVRKEGSKRQTLMWFDPDREFILVRLLQIEPDGKRYELHLDDAKVEG
ncbi:hypothetical protein MSNKSG1_04111 [Marinobacter santoriniensis NKSG1]|uniref:DUF3108 domain-containing protein n=1 Tax=Marinobacter santoriniensis NKSG1 TaxID=1288826 RepID=M7DFQ4_9GAMM|nr:DUF3108 domain-containing protein [Marinobacter santoriniensis]EMP56487.1 hypothetical protein MSNKSG1_04111 [Marinobacter santoriniensis NKSG1]